MAEPKNEALSKNETLAKKLQKVLKAQGTRTEVFSEFDMAFQDYLSGNCPSEQYYSICKIATEGFQEISNEIKEIENNIGDKVIAREIGALQAAEQEKLKKTVNKQIYIIKAKEENRDYDNDIAECDTSLKEIEEKISDALFELMEEIKGVSSLIC